MGAEMEATIGSFLPIILMVAIFYFLLYRPQKQAQKRRLEMLDSLRQGNKVVTLGGIYGTITKLEEKTVKLKVADNVEITVARASINANVTEDEA
jgi:preprotein translocase subunit YajC